MVHRVTHRLLAAALLTLVFSSGNAVRAQADAGSPAAATAAAATASGVPPGTLPASELDRVRLELQQQRELVLLMRQRLADAESARAWLPWLAMGLAATTVLALWLGLQWWRGQRSAGQRRADLLQSQALAAAQGAAAARTEASRQATALASPASPARGSADSHSPHGSGAGAQGPIEHRHAGLGSPTTTAAALALYEADPTTHTLPAVAAPRPPEPAVLASELSLSGQPPRAVTVEELLDLEQQVDFFMVLGQEESAIDLLVSHIRSTGGTSPLPYLKLLEVYRHQGNAEGYERTRVRFNQRFNAYAPDWSGDPSAGRLLDDYPEVLERLQRVWPAPALGMAELETLLFRRHQGELFDLPAYRELLLLYAVARDLHDLEPAQNSPIDLLLPLDDELPDTTSPRPHLGLFSDESLGGRTADWARTNERPALRALHQADDRTVTLRSPELAPPRIDLDMALDIDLSEFSPAPREFTQPAAFNDVDLSRSDFASLDDPPPRRG